MSQAIVMDNGTCMSKVGFAGEDAPRYVFPTVVGRLNRQMRERRNIHLRAGERGPVEHTGSAARRHQGILNLYYPIKNGVITDWEDMEHIWNKAFEKLGVESQEHPILLTDAPLNSKTNREKMAQIMFECYNVPKFSVANHAVLSLFASNRTTGLSCSLGDGASHVVPVSEGIPLPHATFSLGYAGGDITSNFKRSAYYPDELRVEHIRDIKEKISYVAIDFDKEVSKPNEYTYHTLPDGQSVTLGDECFRCFEPLFRPERTSAVRTIQDAMHSAITACDPGLRDELYSNIVLSGGTTLCPGFTERVRKEMAARSDPTPVTIVAPEDRALSVWIGGSILASLDSCESQWITAQEYWESGPSTVNQLCF